MDDFNQKPFNEPIVSHQVFVKQPFQKEKKEPQKDLDIWDPPSPKILKKKTSNWGGNKRNQNKRPNNQNAYGAKSNNPLAGYGNVPSSGGAASAPANQGDGKRNYNKPWLAPEKEKKAEASTYADHVYPDGIGPDTDLINMIERDALVKNPNVQFDDIADLDETKKLL